MAKTSKNNQKTTATKRLGGAAAKVKRIEKFEALSPEKQRVRIAKDVIAQLELKKIKATEGTYFEAFGVSLDPDKGTESQRALQVDNVVKSAKQCQVCALGALFTAQVLIKDKLTVEGADGWLDTWENTVGVPGDGARAYLEAHFSMDQLDLIESAFEKWTDEDRFGYGYNKLKAGKFGEKYRYPRARMIAIMNNIIDNNGTFVP